MKLLQTLGIPALVSMIVSGIVSGYINYTVNIEVQRNAAKVERVMQFSKGGDSLILAALDYIATVKAGDDVSPSRSKIRTEIVKQLHESDSLRSIFPARHQPAINAYQHALQEFSTALPEAKSPISMRKWVEGLDRVNNTRSSLTDALIQEVGVKS